MKRLLAGLLIAVTGSLFAAEAPEKESMRTRAGLYVDAIEAYEMLRNPGDRQVVLIDVRDPIELNFTGYTQMVDVHVPWKIMDSSRWNENKQSYGGYVNPDFAAEVTSRLDALGIGKEAHLVFMCRSGSTRSAPAADALYELGYANVYSMVDGFEGGKAKSGEHQGARVVNGWKNSGLPWGWKLERDVMYGLDK
ncbi:rhodanese-related sulfurtransferase [Thiohalobacter thiocyanaticus]|uniref:Rhodanese-related sulfurtransferase n=1 Tax=Thiohalobacter thiocyanaticus TaxID=585455 RepID=A0A1Z4VQM8_9GAMM|nr:rhodanese-like domain-containing protein [Thiohalobacter thiocyanaticus]BAZ93514.1 rhodanese-related sulfurtransferase [Thiohalobacter thiocyanaticus]